MRKKELTDVDVKNLTSGDLCESFKRGQGALLFRNVGNTTTGYYRYWKGTQSVFIKLGIYRPERTKKAGFTLKELRNLALEMAATRQQVAPQDLKEFLEQQEAFRQREEQSKRRREEIDASHGTLKDLCESYLASLERKEASSTRSVKNCINTYCLKPFPQLAERKAREVEPADIVAIISRMIQKGITTTANRVRSYLHSAFAYGIKADHDPMHITEHGKRFNLSFNPVAAVPRQASFERVRERRLDDDEIYHMWHNVDEGKPGWSPLYGLLVRFCLTCFGNRPKQLGAVKWSDIDFNRRTITFIDRKGKNARPKKRIIPLSPVALNILKQAKKISGHHQWPFSVSGNDPIRIDNISVFLKSYSRKRTEVDGDYESWTAKDLRTTATSLLIRLRIPKEQRYLLQSREDGSIESKHYDHDDRLPEKREAAKIYTAELERIIIEGREANTLIDLAEYREQYR